MINGVANKLSLAVLMQKPYVIAAQLHDVRTKTDRSWYAHEY